MGDNERNAAQNRPGRGFPRDGSQNRRQFRSRAWNRSVLRGPRDSQAAAGSLSYLQRAVPRMGAAHLGHAPAGDLDHTGGYGPRGLPATLQSADRRGRPLGMGPRSGMGAGSADAVRRPGRRTGPERVPTADRKARFPTARPFQSVVQYRRRRCSERLTCPKGPAYALPFPYGPSPVRTPLSSSGNCRTA